jgi:hypothetical protein
VPGEWDPEAESLPVRDGCFDICIEVIREPTPASAGRFRRWSELPLFINVRAVLR